jgi:hypothetical protein
VFCLERTGEAFDVVQEIGTEGSAIIRLDSHYGTLAIDGWCFAGRGGDGG